jgi:glycosyltransferase involved in cell wall biosynthesis
MANCLLERGHDVRIIYCRPALNTSLGLKCELKRLCWRNCFDNTDWLDDFKGVHQSFNKLDDIEYSSGEIVICVGVFFVPYLLELDRDIYKVQYCHGLPGDKSDPLQLFLDHKIPTIAVSEAIVPTLEERSGMKVVGVVPNGIDPLNYFTEKQSDRDGIGTIYDVAYEKAPEDTLELLARIGSKWPDLKQYVFGRVKRPGGIEKQSYVRYPSVEKSRWLYNRSKIWLITSRREGFCLPILEAMACGAVVISTRHDNAELLIEHGVNGFLVDVGGHGAFMRYIQLVLNNDDICRRITRRAYETAAKFTWDSAANKMINCLETITGVKEKDMSFDNLQLQTDNRV